MLGSASSSDERPPAGGDATLDRERRRVLGAKGEATRRRLLAAAEQVFAEAGYHAASVSEMTRRARVAQGTFYVYFDSKLEIFRELVRQISRDVRRVASVASAGARDRLEAEQLGLAAFFRYLRAHGSIYRVLREAEFVDGELFRWYYRRLAEGYTRRLREAVDRGEIRAAGDPEVVAWSIIGAIHMLGVRYVLWEGDDAAAERALETAMEFVRNGVAPRP